MSHPLHQIWTLLKAIPAGILLGLIRFYQLCISPLIPPSCRFQPTCSEYAILAIRKYGVFKGTWKATRRILRCHPWHPGGYDPP